MRATRFGRCVGGGSVVYFALALLPRAGIGAMPELLARRLPPATVGFGAGVEPELQELVGARSQGVDEERVATLQATVLLTPLPAANAPKWQRRAP